MISRNVNSTETADVSTLKVKIVSKALKMKKCVFFRGRFVDDEVNNENLNLPEKTEDFPKESLRQTSPDIIQFCLLKKSTKNEENFAHDAQRCRLGQMVKIQFRESLPPEEPNDCFVVLECEFIGIPDRSQRVEETGNFLCNLYVGQCIHNEIVSKEVPKKCLKKNCTLRHKPNQKEIEKIERRIAKKHRKKEKEKKIWKEFRNESQQHAVAPWKERASCFADWIVDTFTFEYLSQGIILDVAGGKGELSLFLIQKGLNCVVVDPRNQKLSKAMRKKCKQDNITPPPRVQKILDLPLEDFELIELVNQASLIVGLHPDQATGAIVTVATSLRKPFAVVPCCIFSAEFPDRRLENGGFVHSFEDLISWLEERSTNIKRDELNLQGKNLVLFKTKIIWESELKGENELEN